MSRSFFWAWLLSFGMAFALTEASAAVDPAPFATREPTLNTKILGLLDDAQKDIKAGKLQDGIQKLNLAASLEPSNPNILARLAVALNMAGLYENALDRLRRARRMGGTDDVVLGPLLDAMLSLGQNQNVLDLFPDPAPAKHSYAAGMILRARASALQVLGDSAGATAAMSRSLAILNDYDGFMTAGRIALMQGKFDEADAKTDQALKLKPNDIDAQVLKIDLAMQKRQPAKAVEMAERLVATNPKSVSALLTRIKVYLSTNRTDKAEQDVDRILAEKPGMPITQYFKAVILARHGDAKGAWSIAHSLPKEYIQVDPGLALNVANMADAAGFRDSAAAFLNVVVLRFPGQIEPRLRLADIRLRQKSPEHALNALALVQDSTDPRVAVLFARIALMKGDGPGAQKYISRAIESGGGEELRTLDKDVALKSVGDYLARHPANKLVKKQNALLLLGFGELDKARAQYEVLVRDDPADALSLNNLSWLVVKNDPRRALALAQRAAKAAPASPNYLDTLGCMQMNQSDIKGALGSLQKAHELGPDDPEISYHFALALEAGGKGAQSQAILQALVKRGGFGDLDAAKDLLTSKLKMAGQMGR
jgi:tetratricopeptide (TPR) repeat protein